jgi:hypothetical protein
VDIYNVDCEDFLEYLRVESNGDMLARVLIVAMASNPREFNEREWRMLSDHFARRSLCRFFPNWFSWAADGDADIFFRGQRISFKKQQEIFPRLSLRGGGTTCGKVVALRNNLGSSKDGLVFDSKYLLCYQPPIAGKQHFAMGALSQNVVNAKACRAKNDQWLISPLPELCGYYLESADYDEFYAYCESRRDALSVVFQENIDDLFNACVGYILQGITDFYGVQG